MDRQLKQRVVGAAVLVVLGVIFIPIFLDTGTLDTSVPEVAQIPPRPKDDFASRVIPLNEADIDAFDARARARMGGERDPIPDSPAGAPQEPPPADSASVPPPIPPSAAEEPERTALAAPPMDEIADVPVARAGVDAWTVQLGSFTNDGNAKRLIEKLRAGGFAAYLERRVESDTAAFKVRVGPQIRREEAEIVRRRLEKEFALKGILLRYRQ